MAQNTVYLSNILYVLKIICVLHLGDRFYKFEEDQIDLQCFPECLCTCWFIVERMCQLCSEEC
jgi:hypothetical protein